MESRHGYEDVRVRTNGSATTTTAYPAYSPVPLTVLEMEASHQTGAALEGMP